MFIIVHAPNEKVKDKTERLEWGKRIQCHHLKEVKCSYHKKEVECISLFIEQTKLAAFDVFT